MRLWICPLKQILNQNSRRTYLQFTYAESCPQLLLSLGFCIFINLDLMYNIGTWVVLWGKTALKYVLEFVQFDVPLFCNSVNFTVRTLQFTIIYLSKVCYCLNFYYNIINNTIVDFPSLVCAELLRIQACSLYLSVNTVLLFCFISLVISLFPSFLIYIPSFALYLKKKTKIQTRFKKLVLMCKPQTVLGLTLFELSVSSRHYLVGEPA